MLYINIYIYIHSARALSLGQTDRKRDRWSGRGVRRQSKHTPTPLAGKENTHQRHLQAMQTRTNAPCTQRHLHPTPKPNPPNTKSQTPNTKP